MLLSAEILEWMMRIAEECEVRWTRSSVAMQSISQPRRTLLLSGSSRTLRSQSLHFKKFTGLYPLTQVYQKFRNIYNCFKIMFFSRFSKFYDRRTTNHKYKVPIVPNESGACTWSVLKPAEPVEKSMFARQCFFLTVSRSKKIDVCETWVFC